MKKTFVNKRFFKDTEHISIDYNSESQLYIKNNELHKIINNELIQVKEDTINNLEKINHKYCANQTAILYDRKGTIGYSMYYYDLYRTIDKLIDDKNIPYKDRMEILKKIYEVFEFFNKMNFSYDDIHEKNILYYKKDIKIVDLDCGIFKDKDNYFEFSVSKKTQDMRLARLLLSILYGIPYDQIQDTILLNSNELLRRTPDNIKKLICYIISGKFSNFDSSSYLDLLTEEYVNDTKLILK